MSDTQGIVGGFSKDQLRAMLAEAVIAEKLVEQASAHRLAKQGEEFLTTVVGDTTEETSDGSAWVGHSARGLEFQVDGVTYTASVTITNVSRTEGRKPVVTHAKAVAKAGHMSVDDTKALIKVALDQHESVSA